MKASDSPTRPRPVLLVGAGRRPNELGAVMAALGAVRARMGGEAQEPHRPTGLEDLEELLATRPTKGTLILDYEHVPGEDVGFVRRFLERHPGWRTVVVGAEGSDRRAQALLALPGTLWLPWPPDLDQVGALLHPPGSAGRAPAPTERAPGPAPLAGHADPPPLDVGRLLEELVAGATVLSGSGPSFRFQSPGPLPVRRERGPLAEAIGSFLTLARACAGEGERVDARAGPMEESAAEAASGLEPGGPLDGVRVRLEFPRGHLAPVSGQLTSESWGRLLEGAPASPQLERALSGARRGADRLRAIGARVLLLARDPDRLRVELCVASEPLEPARDPSRNEPNAPMAPLGPPDSDAAKAEDPFA